MPRRREVPKRKILADPVFGSIKIAKFMNHVMRSGKKALSETIVYNALDIIKEKVSSANPLEVFEKALDNVKPLVEVKSRRVGGATYQVPIEVREDRSIALSMRWLIDAARSRREKSMPARLAAELIEAFEGRGSAIKKREDTHRMAEANKAFSHYRW